MSGKINAAFTVRIALSTSYRLTRKSLDRQMKTAAKMRTGWPDCTLKFLSFNSHKLELLNTHRGKSYLLNLSIYNNQLHAYCNCGAKQRSGCVHIYNALRLILWDFGETYFAGLTKGGIMQLAFRYQGLFDKMQSKSGIKAELRPELGTVFALDESVTSFDLPSILALHDNRDQAIHRQQSVRSAYNGEEAVGYLVVLPLRNRFLPFVVPCAGKLTVSGKSIKYFYEVLSGAQKQYSHLLDSEQEKLNKACFALWKKIEKQSDLLFVGNAIQRTVQRRRRIFESWQQMMRLLESQSYTYAYWIFRIKELTQGRPKKQSIHPVSIGLTSPVIGFCLADCGCFFQLRLEIYVDEIQITEFDNSIPFLILSDKRIYLYKSLKDATVAQWMHHFEGKITVFKEHFSAFKEEILNLIREHYPIREIIMPKDQIPLYHETF